MGRLWANSASSPYTLSDSALNVVTLEIDVSTTDRNYRLERHNPMANIECAVHETCICFSSRLTITKMAQTEETKKALERDENLCQWCLHRLDRQRSVFYPVKNYHPRLGGGHHAFGRARVDVADAIISLCPEHHYLAQTYKISQKEIVSLLSEIVGYDLREKYREFYQW